MTHRSRNLVKMEVSTQDHRFNNSEIVEPESSEQMSDKLNLRRRVDDHKSSMVQVTEEDIQVVMASARVDRNIAINALNANNGELVKAIMSIID